MSDTDNLFFPLNQTSVALNQHQKCETDISRQKLYINKQFENAIETYQKTKRREKVVGNVSIKD